MSAIPAPKLDVNVADFAKHIDAVRRETGRDSEEMLKYVMILMLKTGRAATPLGRKNRALVERDVDPDTDSDLIAAGQITTGKARFFRVWKQGNPVPRHIFVPRIPRASKRNPQRRAQALKARDEIVAKFKKIKFRGIAKASWGWAMKMVWQKAALTEAADTLAVQAQNNPISVSKQLAGNSPSIEVENKLGYILKIAKGIEQQMMNSADRQLQAWLERRWQTALDRADKAAA